MMSLVDLGARSATFCDDVPTSAAGDCSSPHIGKRSHRLLICSWYTSIKRLHLDSDKSADWSSLTGRASELMRGGSSQTTQEAVASRCSERKAQRQQATTQHQPTETEIELGPNKAKNENGRKLAR